ncbi:hypothetical protein PF004_g30784 [Phytophthora fragariae]|uniref:Uncharacterized protein n=1 Tax=Phytophthora fragariae TaxID=53985 RepID=A0A6G0MCM9_9STRA|nr:hypothetical protein PF004_g30784 [Phytophthora fragariae]
MVAASAPRIACCSSPARCPARVTKDCGGVRAADCMLQLPSSKGCPAAWRAADGNLPLPSRRFMTPEVGWSWRYNSSNILC